jgi:hypothetical protein
VHDRLIQEVVVVRRLPKLAVGAGFGTGVLEILTA